MDYYKKIPSEYLTDLINQVDDHFSIDELQVLCFEMEVNWDELTGSTKRLRTASLIAHLLARKQLEDLIALLYKERPSVDWPEVPSASDLTVSNTSHCHIVESVPIKAISVRDATLQEILHLYYPEVWSEIIQRGLYKKTLNLSDLLKKIRDYFNESELRDICFTLGIDYGQLGGEHYYDKARELISYCKRNGKLSDLIKLCKEQRPFIIWDYE